jgi:hypothetical protein
MPILVICSRSERTASRTVMDICENSAPRREMVEVERRLRVCV